MKHLPFESIIFVTQQANQDSEKMLGFRTVELLRARGFKTNVLASDQVAAQNIRKSVILLVKCWDTEKVIRWRNNDNIVVAQISDLIAADRLHDVELHTPLNCLIYPNKKCLQDFGYLFSKTPNQQVLPHFWDDRFQPHLAQEFSLCFLGSNRSVNYEMHQLDIPNLHALKSNQQLFESVKVFSCHYSVRRTSTLSFNYKPQSKLFTAAACRANIIASRDAGFIEVLPEYPYYCDGSYQEVMAKIENAKSDWSTPRWREALSLLENLKSTYGTEAYIKHLINILCFCSH